MQLAFRLDEDDCNIPGPLEGKGVVYTREWVVELMLDLAGYSSSRDLSQLRAVEPAAGTGAFFLPMIRRLLASWRDHGQPVTSLSEALRAYEIDPGSAEGLRRGAADELIYTGVTPKQAADIAEKWVVNGDYLLDSVLDQECDFIIGNPPYIRYDDLPEILISRYRRMYQTMRGRCDIYVAFFEAALAQLKPHGVCAFICADRWMRSAYGSELRRLISQRASVDVVIEMHDAPAFEQDVSAYPAVTILRRKPQGAVLVATADAAVRPLGNGEKLSLAVKALATRERSEVPGMHAALLSGWYTGADPWPWADPEVLDLLQRIEARYRPLEDAMTGTKVGIGVATGSDKVFITTDPTIVEPDRLLPLAMAGDTRSGKLVWSGHYLVSPWENTGELIDLAKYPRVQEYYYRHAAVLHSRNIANRDRGRWYRTIDRVNHALLHREKLYFPDMKGEAQPVLDHGRTYPHHNLYFVLSDVWDLEVLGGLLLSRIAELFVSSYCVKMRGGTLRFQAQYLRRIRVPEPARIPPDIAQRLREAFLRYDREAATEAAMAAYGIAHLPSAA